MIRILDNSTINKIAAGEVIEKPVNVVKELVENSIDAGSKHISVEIKGGGIDYIRVTDDGAGIPYEEVPTAFLRHATSKIVSSEDLFFLNTLGFRGEALASIASVSRTEMITKVSDELMGTKINLDCGSVIELTKTGAPEGTTIIIKDLFFNVPARKKFLNSAQAEATKIIEMMEELVLSHPDVAFQLIVNGQVKIQSNGSDNVKDIIYRLYGKEVHDALLPLDYEDEFIKITGFITKPECCRPSRSGENYFINGRYSKNDFITRGIEEGYRNFLMQHKFPFVVLFIYMDPFGLDINVHPAKSEIRITNGEFLIEILDKNIRKILSETELIPSAFSFKEEKKELERNPEPFEKELIKNSYVIQKGYDSSKNMNSIKDSETAPNDKSKEFSADFEEDNKPDDSKPNNEYMNHTRTISYKSKYNKLEERMKNPDEDDKIESATVDQAPSNGNVTNDSLDSYLGGSAPKETAANVVSNDPLDSYLGGSAPKSNVETNTVSNDPLDSYLGGSAPKDTTGSSLYDNAGSEVNNGSALNNSSDNEYDHILDKSDYEHKIIKKEEYSSRVAEAPETAAPVNSTGSALLKNRMTYEGTPVSSGTNMSSQGSALYKGPEKNYYEASVKPVEDTDVTEEVRSNDEVIAAEEVISSNEVVNAGNEEVNNENVNTESEVAETVNETNNANQFEEWLNSIEAKDSKEIAKENSGLIVKVDPATVQLAEKIEENDAFNEFDIDKKLDLIDRLGEKKEEVSDLQRLMNADKKYSVLNDSIAPVNQDSSFEPKVTFRVKDFDKDEDDEVSSPVKENVDSLFKKVDRFKSTSKRNTPVKEEQSVLFTEKTLDPSKLSKFKIIDQIFDTYWLISVENELLIMDQHAAHEKVLYEKFMDKFENNKIETQTLMLSQVVNLSKSEMDVYLRYKKEFEKFGFIINDFGDKDLFIRGVPTDLFGTDAKSLFLDILAELINVSPSLHIDVIETRIATRACKAAIKGNQKITKDECQKLIEYMLTLKNPYQCPHGRPTLIRITKTDLEKMFKRIVS